MGEKQIFWIASYPKSGNTLIRTILVSLFFTNDGKFNFKLLDLILLFEHTQRLEYIKKKCPEDFEKLKDANVIYKYFLELQTKEKLGLKEDFCFLKTHGAQLNYYDQSFTTKENSRGLIYIVRDPRDVAISYAKHFNKSIDDQIDFMIDQKSRISFLQNSKNKNINAFAPLSSWDVHFNSWKDFDIPKLIIRYEDLIKNKKNIILLLIEFFEKNYQFNFSNIEQKIENILLTTNFKIMQEYEKQNKFKEASNHSNFFRFGTSNQWKNVLNKKQTTLIENNFLKVMKLLHYL